MTKEQVQLIEDNLRFAPYIFHKYFASTSVSQQHYDDLISSSYLGLCKAAINFDPTKSTKFTSYASRVIYNEIGMEFRRLNPRAKHEVSFETEIVTDLDGNSATYHDMLEANHSDPADIAQWNESLTALQEKLKPKYNKIYNLWIQGYNQRETAERTGYAQSYICRIFRSWREFLQNHSKEKLV